MDPLYFVGVPDWRSLLLAVIFTLPWLVWLGRGYLRSRWLWVAVVGAAIVFPFSIAWVQVPLQQVYNAWLLNIMDQDTVRQNVLLLAIPSVFLSGLVQESAKLLVAIGALRMLGERLRPRTGLAFGAAAGAGYGGFEAFWVFNQIFATGFSLGTIQLGGPLVLLGFLERFFTVPFHVGTTALSAYGYVTGRPWRFLVLAITLHTVINYGVVLVQTGVFNSLLLEIWVAAISVGTIGAALWLRHRTGGVAPL